MKRKQTRLADLPSDVLKHIMIFVAKSFDGEANFARAISTCKELKELAMDTDILKAVEFRNVLLFGNNGSFWQINGLLIRCARVGNLTACSVLLERIKALKNSIEMNLRVSRLIIRKIVEHNRVVNRRVCTRAMTRKNETAIKMTRRLLDVASMDLQKADELLQVMK